MIKGITFDIKEFSINDGPGVRITIFMKGCPLRCIWCHNPEGISSSPQFNCQTKKLVGRKWSTWELAEYLRSYESFFQEHKGGLTFSGGEPAMQAEFLIECVKELPTVHKLLDTSGYCEPDRFIPLSDVFDMFYFDLKIIDTRAHEYYTGVSNRLIWENLRYLMKNRKPTVIRMPMIPGITDTRENLRDASELISRECHRDTEIHLLPYNALAGGKYPVYGMRYPLENGYTKNHRDVINWFENCMLCRGYKVRNYVRGKKDE